LKLHVRVEDEFGHEHYAEVCTAPCDTTIAPDEYRLALSLPGNDPVESKHRLALRGPSILRAHYESRAVLSAVLLVSGFVVGLSGFLLWAAADADHGAVCGAYEPSTDAFSGGGTSCHPKGPDAGLLAASELAWATASALAVAWFFVHGDKAIIEVVPSAGLPLSKNALVERGRGQNVPGGLVLRMKF
jgi:hypothetical protein